jgi:hypothetical protein
MTQPENKAQADPNTLSIAADNSKSSARIVAELGMSSVLANASTARAFSRTFGEMAITEAVEVLQEKVAAVNANDLKGLEATLTAQAVALNTIFTELAKRASTNMGEYLQATETYLRLAFKAQAQCRATIETLAEIKNPRPVAFVKQANFAQGPQQVNNSVEPAASRAGESENLQNKLLEARNDECLDVRATSAASSRNPALETVGALNRAEDALR